MARQESDREDLLREATALVERAEWRVAGWPEPVVAGFRSSGALALYFGADPVFQFDPEGRVRRAYRDGRLYRSQGTELAELVHERTDTETILRRTDLTGPGLAAFLADLRERLSELHRALERGDVSVLGQVPPDRDLRSKVRDVLTTLLSGPLHLSPAVPTRKL